MHARHRHGLDESLPQRGLGDIAVLDFNFAFIIVKLLAIV